jgi:hypothetical protein
MSAFPFTPENETHATIGFNSTCSNLRGESRRPHAHPHKRPLNRDRHSSDRPRSGPRRDVGQALCFRLPARVRVEEVTQEVIRREILVD